MSSSGARFPRSIVFLLLITAVASSIVLINLRRGGDASADAAKQDAGKEPRASQRPDRPAGDRPEKRGNPADPYEGDTVESVLALKGTLPADEYARRLGMACHRMKDADPAAIRAALQDLPPGKDSQGAFNSLTFHLLQKDPAGGYKFLARLGKEGVFPERWIWNAGLRGLEAMGEEDPHGAIRALLANPEIFDTAIKQGIAAINALSLYNRDPQPGDHELYAFFMNRIGKDALPVAQNNLMFWKFALGTPGIPDASLPPADKLSKSNLTALGEGAAQLPSLGDGLGALQRMGDPPAATRKFYGKWFERDVNHTLANIDRIADPAVRDQVLFDNIPQIGEWDKAASVQWANAIRDETLRNKALERAK